MLDGGKHVIGVFSNGMRSLEWWTAWIMIWSYLPMVYYYGSYLPDVASTYLQRFFATSDEVQPLVDTQKVERPSIF
jgi:hypothetical protein